MPNRIGVDITKAKSGLVRLFENIDVLDNTLSDHGKKFVLYGAKLITAEGSSVSDLNRKMRVNFVAVYYQVERLNFSDVEGWFRWKIATNWVPVKGTHYAGYSARSSPVISNAIFKVRDRSRISKQRIGIEANRRYPRTLRIYDRLRVQSSGLGGVLSGVGSFGCSIGALYKENQSAEGYQFCYNSGNQIQVIKKSILAVVVVVALAVTVWLLSMAFEVKRRCSLVSCLVGAILCWLTFLSSLTVLICY
jgi:hypothetical protein